MEAVSANANQEAPFDVIFKEKCENFIQLILDSTIFIGEWEKKAQVYGPGLKEHLVLEVLIGYAMLIVLLDKKFGWTLEKLQSINKVEDENKVLDDCITLFEQVAKGDKIKEAIKLKDHVNKEDFQHKLFRYLLFFANVHSVAQGLLKPLPSAKPLKK